ncbi:hypothetical protein [Amycolatopsis sp. PS_44_ISF1]|uniref:hypothetical protein n=1 Tax=Amycolatopsis sp. PS_44_ISF1 TaxID=2974917 RepID=UPI0028DD8D60|nr:hypothetical protein [Amycolatopsis sp. PS_44_ISF1]MDT8912375.1 hypothetical protein [Amycolatopsis sp. PS_44_ISF1]
MPPSAPHDDVPAALTRLAETLPTLDPAATAHIVLTLWEGVGLARACGVIAATQEPADPPGRWTRRRRNAETVEYLLAQQLTRTAAAKNHQLQLYTPHPHPRTGHPDTAITAVLAFTDTAGPAAQDAAAAADTWDDRRSLSACTTLTTELAACWRGQRPAYQLRLDPPAPPWWTGTTPGPEPR